MQFQEQIQSLHQLGWTGKGIHIGHLDSGVDALHPALTGTIMDYCAIDEAGKIISKSYFQDHTGHGTQTASLICGEEIGVSPNAQIYAASVLEGGKSIIRILKGLEWLLAQPIDILCMPLGVRDYHPIFETALYPFHQKQIPIIAPIGNYGMNSFVSPACYPNVLAIGSLDQKNEVANFSGSIQLNSHFKVSKPDLVAEGEALKVAKKGGGFDFTKGTSMSAALVTGVIALLKEAFPNISTRQLYQILKNTANSSNIEKYRSGHGIIQPLKAFQSLENTVINDGVNSLNPPFIPYWTDKILDHTLKKAGKEDIIEAVIYIETPDEMNRLEQYFTIQHHFQSFQLVLIQGEKHHFGDFMNNDMIHLMSSVYCYL
jgi:subtilisin family serine protease